MKRSIFSMLFAVWSIAAFGQSEYILIIDNDSMSISIDENQAYTTKSGDKINIRLTQPDIQRYSDDMISFEHSKNLNVSNAAIEDGIDQCVALRPTGSGFLVQKYRILDPSSLTQLMMNEMIKESISYGYEKEEVSFTKTLASGQVIQGSQATLTYKGDKEVYTVATYGGKDEGIIVVTMNLSGNTDDQAAIDLFLNTLRLN